MDDKNAGEVKVANTTPRTRRKTSTTSKANASDTKNTVSSTRTRQSITRTTKTAKAKNDILEKATLKAMAVSLVEALGSKEGVTISEKIKQLDKSLKEEKKIKEELAKNIKKLAKHQVKVAKFEEKIAKFNLDAKNLQERCSALKSNIDLYKDELAAEISKM